MEERQRQRERERERERGREREREREREGEGGMVKSYRGMQRNLKVIKELEKE